MNLIFAIIGVMALAAVVAVTEAILDARKRRKKKKVTQMDLKWPDKGGY